jgi:ABC-type microcin C transport system duplicated ATPase subunit YejF
LAARISEPSAPTNGARDQLVGEEILRLFLIRLQNKLGVAYLFITYDLGAV